MGWGAELVKGFRGKEEPGKCLGKCKLAVHARVNGGAPAHDCLHQSGRQEVKLPWQRATTLWDRSAGLAFFWVRPMATHRCQIPVRSGLSLGLGGPALAHVLEAG